MYRYNPDKIFLILIYNTIELNMFLTIPRFSLCIVGVQGISVSVPIKWGERGNLVITDPQFYELVY